MIADITSTHRRMTRWGPQPAPDACFAVVAGTIRREVAGLHTAPKASPIVATTFWACVSAWFRRTSKRAITGVYCRRSEESKRRA